jgi:surfactin synthase thioesterase subunit
VVEEHGGDELMDGWLRSYRAAAPGSPALICLPHAGGAASAYLPLARALAPRVEVLAVQYPGRQDRRRERAVEDIGEFADMVAEAARGLGDRPFALFGHSMGALIGYEAARRLERGAGNGMSALFVSGRSAPGPRPNPRDLLDGDAALIAEIRRLGGTGAQVFDDPELMGMVLPALRADYRALSRYRWTPGEPLRCPLTVLLGESDPVVSAAGAAAWRELTSGQTRLISFPGGHFYLDEQVSGVARVLSAALGRAEQEQPAGDAVP